MVVLPYIDKILRVLYQVFAYISAFFLFLILVAVILQVGSRWLHLDILGVSEFAGYFMAISAFLMAPYALITGAHVRMDLFLSKSSGYIKKCIVSGCLIAGNAVSIYIAYYAVKYVQVSHMLGDVSQGIDATPLWIPQSGMAIGAVLFAVAMAHFTILRIFCGDTTLEQSGGEA